MNRTKRIRDADPGGKLKPAFLALRDGTRSRDKPVPVMDMKRWGLLYDVGPALRAILKNPDDAAYDAADAVLFALEHGLERLKSEDRSALNTLIDAGALSGDAVRGLLKMAVENVAIHPGIAPEDLAEARDPQWANDPVRAAEVYAAQESLQ